MSLDLILNNGFVEEALSSQNTEDHSTTTITATLTKTSTLYYNMIATLERRDEKTNWPALETATHNYVAAPTAAVQDKHAVHTIAHNSANIDVKLLAAILIPVLLVMFTCGGMIIFHIMKMRAVPQPATPGTAMFTRAINLQSLKNDEALIRSSVASNHHIDSDFSKHVLRAFKIQPNKFTYPPSTSTSFSTNFSMDVSDPAPVYETEIHRSQSVYSANECSSCFIDPYKQVISHLPLYLHGTNNLRLLPGKTLSPLKTVPAL